jgi:hypothetical protein
VTVVELPKLLSKRPDDTPVCYTAGDKKGTIVEVSEVRAVDVTGSSQGYYAAIGHYGDRKVAVVK